MVHIAVLGYGTVGSGVVEVIDKNSDSVAKRAGDEINIKYVRDLREFPGDRVESVLVHDIDTILNDPEVVIVVEVMGGVEPAYTLSKNPFWPVRAYAPPIKSWLRPTDRSLSP